MGCTLLNPIKKAPLTLSSSPVIGIEIIVNGIPLTESVIFLVNTFFSRIDISCILL